MRISDWSSDVCSSDLRNRQIAGLLQARDHLLGAGRVHHPGDRLTGRAQRAVTKLRHGSATARAAGGGGCLGYGAENRHPAMILDARQAESGKGYPVLSINARSEENTSELQSLMRSSY